MTNINIENLESFGLDLLSDRESYLNEISKDEFDAIHGGISPTVLSVIETLAASIAVSASVRQIHDKNNLWSPVGWL